MTRTILVALDGSARSVGVFDAAVEYARAMGARLVLFRGLVIPPDFGPAGTPATADSLAEFLEKQSRAQLLVLSAGAPDVHCDLRVERAVQPWRSILAAAESVDADLIVLGSHGFHGWDRILGTTVGKVANLAHRNVMVVHDRERPSGAFLWGRDDA